MFIQKATPAQRLVLMLKQEFNLSIKVMTTESNLLNRLSSKDTRHFLSLVKKLRLFDLSVVGEQHPSINTVHAVIRLLKHYSFKVIQMVVDALNHYKLLDAGYFVYFLELMNSFESASDCQHFVNIFNLHAYAPVLSMQWRSPMYRKDEILKPLLLLKDQGHKLHLIEYLFKKIAHTRYLAHHRNELLVLDFDSLNHTAAIIDLLNPLKLVNDHNLQSILQHSRLAQNTTHSPDGLNVQLTLLNALCDSKLLTQRNIDQLNAIKLSASRSSYSFKENDLNSPIFYFIPVILDRSAHKILTQTMLDEVFENVKRALGKENVFVRPLETTLIKVTLANNMYHPKQRKYLANAFFEGSGLTLVQSSIYSTSHPMQLSP